MTIVSFELFSLVYGFYICTRFNDNEYMTYIVSGDNTQYISYYSQ